MKKIILLMFLGVALTTLSSAHSTAGPPASPGQSEVNALVGLPTTVDNGCIDDSANATAFIDLNQCQCVESAAVQTDLQCVDESFDVFWLAGQCAPPNERPDVSLSALGEEWGASLREGILSAGLFSESSRLAMTKIKNGTEVTLKIWNVRTVPTCLLQATDGRKAVAFIHNPSKQEVRNRLISPIQGHAVVNLPNGFFSMYLGVPAAAPC